ncbi:MAG: Trp repressor [Candidatus Levybacteria bacterium GW2011_GWA2_40_8]|nr:MAG: Trp repressor [Candidatus Levybacteria bacterium GW2011_GWA2_40_8]
MSQISKYQMDKILEERMFSVFYQTLADLRKKDEVQEFLNDLLTPTERIMLAKRLAIATLLIKGTTYEYIRDVIKVSTSTIMGVKTWLNIGGKGYLKAVTKLIRNEKFDAFLDKTEELIEKLTIPRPGSDWSKKRSQSWKEYSLRRKKRII